MKKEIPTSIKLSAVREVHDMSHLNRWELIRYTGTPVEVGLKTMIIPSLARNRLTMRVTAEYTTTRDLVERRLLEYTAEAVFEIPNLQHIVEATDNSVIVPSELISLMLSVTIGALRGMIAVRTTNTFLSRYPLPVYRIDTLVNNMAGATRREESVSPVMTFTEDVDETAKPA